MAARRATVNRGRHPLRLAPDLDAEQLGVTERLAAGTAGDAHQRLDRGAAGAARGDHDAAAARAGVGHGPGVGEHEPPAPAAAQAEPAAVAQLLAVAS